MLFGGMCPLVISVPCAGGGMFIFGTERDCCAVDASRGAFGCADYPSKMISCTGDAKVVIFLVDLGVMELK